MPVSGQHFHHRKQSLDLLITRTTHTVDVWSSDYMVLMTMKAF
jgi:hypothetical protein